MADPTLSELLTDLQTPGEVGFIPVRSTFQPPPAGGLLGAVFRQENTIGSAIEWFSHKKPAYGVNDPDFNYLQHIPIDLLDWSDKFAQARNNDDIDATANKIRREQNDRALMAQSPGKSFLYGFFANALDPSILFPGSIFYKEARAGMSIGKSAIGVGIASAGQAAFQESFLANQQITRTFEESMNNTIASGIFGAALGGLGGVFANSPSGKFAKDEINNVLSDGKINTNAVTAQGAAGADLIPGEALKQSEGLFRLGRIYGATIGNIAPYGRMIKSEFSTVRKYANDLFENTLINNKNTESFGFQASDPSLEVLIKSHKEAAIEPMSRVFDLYYEQRGVHRGPLKNMRSSLTKEGMGIDEFWNSTIREIITGKKNESAQVNKAAQILTNEIFEPLAKQAAELNLLPENVKPKNAVGYFSIIYNKPLLIEQETAFLNEVKTWLKEVNGVRKELDPEITRLQKTIADAEVKLKKTKGKSAIAKIEAMIANTKKALDELVPDSLKDSDGNVRRIIDDGDDVEFDAISKQIFDNIIGNNEEKMLNPIYSKLTRTNTGGARPLNQRAFMIPHERILDWTIQDIPRVVQSYVNGMAHAIEMERYAKRLGLEHSGEILDHFKSMLKIEHDTLKKGASPATRKKLMEQRKALEKDMLDSLDIIRGVYGAGPNIIDGKAGEYLRTLGTYNFIRLMGFMTLSSVSDAGMIVFKNGFFASIYNGLLPSLRSITEAKWDKALLNSIGRGFETSHATRVKSFIDQDSLTAPTGMFGRTIDGLSQRFGNFNLINQWSDMLTNAASRAFIHKTLKSIVKWSETGKMTAKERTRLANLFLGDKEFKEIAKAFKEHGSIEGGSYYMNWGNWNLDSKEASNAFNRFRLAALTEIDATVIRPTKADLPKFQQTNLGKLILQFKSWNFAATNKILAAGLQRRDSEVAAGVVSLLSLGALSYVITSMVRGQEPDLSFEKLAQEAIDRSGLLGITTEVFNIGQKMFGIDGASRYNSRGVFSAMLGPSLGVGEDTVSFINKAIRDIRGDAQLTTNDWQKVQRLFPYQNLFYMYWLNRQITDSVATSLGAAESARK